MPPSNKTPPVGPLIALLSLGLAIALFFILFEIKPAPPKEKLSAEARSNKLLALQRWLEAENKVVYDREPFTGMELFDFEADCFIVDARSFDIQGLMLVDLLARARQGNLLMIHSLNVDLLSPQNKHLIDSTGLRIITDEEETDSRIEAAEYLSVADYSSDEPDLSFDKTLRIDSSGDTKALRLWTDKDSIARMAEIPLGRGRIILCGSPFFMQNSFIEEEKNALLTWDILGEGKTCLFIRGDSPSPALFGYLLEKGNPAFFLAALALLVISGFWMHLASFGRALPDTDESEGPSFARWLHEGRFLRKYRALDSLVDPWRRHLARRLDTGPGDSSMEERAAKAAKTSGIPEESVLDLFTGPPTDTMRRFRRRMQTIHTLVEKL